MSRSEIAVLRTKLRALNIEYSALVRGGGEDRCVRKEVLRVERRALMALIAQQQRDNRERHAAVGNLAGALPLADSEIDAAYAAGAMVGTAAPAIDSPTTT